MPNDINEIEIEKGCLYYQDRDQKEFFNNHLSFAPLKHCVSAYENLS